MKTTHVYTGPTTRWGLAHGTKCTIVGRRGGGLRIRAGSGIWIVGAHQVETDTAEWLKRRRQG